MTIYIVSGYIGNIGLIKGGAHRSTIKKYILEMEKLGRTSICVRDAFSHLVCERKIINYFTYGLGNKNIIIDKVDTGVPTEIQKILELEGRWLVDREPPIGFIVLKEGEYLKEEKWKFV